MGSKFLKGFLCKLKFSNHCFEHEFFLFIDKKRFHSNVDVKKKITIIMVKLGFNEWSEWHIFFFG